MNPIESGGASTASFDSLAENANVAANSSAAANTSSSANTSAAAGAVTSAASATTSASSVSTELQAFKQQSGETTIAASSDQLSLINKVVNALVNVVTALVSVVSTLVGQIKSAPTNAASSTGSAGSVGANQSGPFVRSALDVNRNDAGMITVRTLDGFTIRAEGRDQAWSITGPDGKTTRIWGDPHVSESDGDKWDFLKRSTFMFGKNKATIEVVPAGNGQTLSARLTIYSDYERVTIDGIDKNQPTVVATSSDGLQHDASLADGDIYRRSVTANGEAWVSAATGKVVSVTR